MFHLIRKTSVQLLLVFGMLSFGWADEITQGKVFNKDYKGIKKISAIIDTDEGVIEVDLNFKQAPQTVANFVELSNKKFYNGLTFHRVIHGFMTQGGCPKGDGTGGPGYTFNNEDNKLKHEEGVIAMANSGVNTNGSQFYITHMPQPHLDGKHTVFGKVTKGFDVLVRIEKGDIIKSVRINEEK